MILISQTISFLIIGIAFLILGLSIKELKSLKIVGGILIGLFIAFWIVFYIYAIDKNDREMESRLPEYSTYKAK